MKKLFLLLSMLVLISACIQQPRHISDQSISGIIHGDQIWEGNILITGDVRVTGDLTILPGTIVKFAVQDDTKKGYEVPADGYNDLDPTRLLSYSKTHSSLTVEGKLNASGTPERRILFTSASESPRIADWEAIYPFGDGSIIEYATIEYSRNGVSPGNGHLPNTIIRNSIIRYTMWGPVSAGYSGCQAYNNEIYECGHEGLDVQGGNSRMENNTIYNCHVGIVVLRGSAILKNNIMKNVSGANTGTGIHIGGDATPILENNYFELAPQDSNLRWCYEDFCYVMHGDPIGTAVLTEVYKENNLQRYAVPSYKIKQNNYEVELPVEAKDWLAYGWKDDRWQKIEIQITGNRCKFPEGYSMYVLIPNPTGDEKDTENFNKEHADVYKIMAV